MLQIALERDGNDFHIVMGMGPKPHARGDAIVIQYPQGTELHPFGIVVVCKTKTVVALKPPMVGMAPTCSGMVDFLHSNRLLIFEGSSYKLGVRSDDKKRLKEIGMAGLMFLLGILKGRDSVL
jgi:hypothetical protein